MKRLVACAVATMSMLGVCGAGNAKGHLSATLERNTAKSSTSVSLTVRNDGDAPIAMLRQQIPLVLINGRNLPSNLFNVREVGALSGGAVTYAGMLSHPVVMPDASFIVFAPGESVHVEYDPANDYRLEPSRTYQISYIASGAVHPTDDLGRLKKSALPIGDQELIESNPIEVTTGDDFSLPRSFSLRFPSRPGFDDEKGESEALSQALMSAYNMIAIAAQEYQAGEPPLYFRPNTYSVNGGNYTWWFGAYREADEGYIRGTIRALRKRIDMQFMGTNPVRNVNFINGRSQPVCTADPGTAAIAHTGSVVSENT